MQPRKLLTLIEVVALTVAITLILLTGLTYAQESVQPQAPSGTSTIAPGAIPVQGRLTNASGIPLNGTYTMTFRLYDVETGGTALCSQTHSVVVQNGLFNSYLDNCYNDVWGQKLWFSVQVGSDLEMAPRQVILPVTYALSLVPGALISGTRDGILTIVGTGGPGDYDALSVYASGTGEAVTASALNGVGVAAHSDGNLAIQGHSFNTTTVPAVYGCVAASGGDCNTAQADNAAGVMGYSVRDYGLYGVGGAIADGGVYGEANNVLGVGVWAKNNSGGTALYGETTSSGSLVPTLYLVQHTVTDTANFIIAANSYGGSAAFRVDGTGNVKQDLNSDGLVKAGISDVCGGFTGPAARSFNNVNSATIVITGTASGTCTINFGFNVFNRYFVATSASSGARFVSCYTQIANPNELYCHNWNTAGTAVDGSIMLMVY